MSNADSLMRELLNLERRRAVQFNETEQRRKMVASYEKQLKKAEDDLKAMTTHADDLRKQLRKMFADDAADSPAEAAPAEQPAPPLAEALAPTSFPQLTADQHDRPGRRKKGAGDETRIDT